MGLFNSTDLESAAAARGDSVKHTPVGALAAGAVVHLGNGLVGIATSAIAAATQGTLQVEGIAYFRKEVSGTPAITFAVGENPGWDETNNRAVPNGTGSFNLNGKVTEASADADDYVLVKLNSGEGAVQAVNPDATDVVGNSILPGVTAVDVGAFVTDTDDYIVLPALASVPVGHSITVVCNAGSAFEVRTPAASAEEINSEDCDGTKEYLATDTEIITFIKISNTIGWMGTAVSALGTAVTAVVPD